MHYKDLYETDPVKLQQAAWMCTLECMELEWRRLETGSLSQEDQDRLARLSKDVETYNTLIREARQDTPCTSQTKTS